MPWQNGQWVNEDPWGANPGQPAGGVAPQSQATTSSDPAALAQHMASGGAFNTIFDPNQAGGNTGYNPAQYASDPFAQALAGNLGASVVNTRNIASPAGNVPSQRMLDFGGGFAGNAGLIGQMYAKYGKDTADRMLADEMRSSGGGFNPAVQNAEPSMFQDQVRTGGASFMPGMNLGTQFGGPGGTPQQVQPRNQTPGVNTGNPAEMAASRAMSQPNMWGGGARGSVPGMQPDIARAQPGMPGMSGGQFDPFGFGGMSNMNAMNFNSFGGGGMGGFGGGMNPLSILGGFGGGNMGGVGQMLNLIQQLRQGQGFRRRPQFMPRRGGDSLYFSRFG